jgi:hypothetical protein|tara:strand:- start:446 stop:670 length:225 start_codon:yes stop_codon:yes gene_type:complete
MNTPSNQIFADIDFLVDIMGMNADDCDEILRACEDLGGISAEYFCEEFVFITEDPDDIPRLHDDNYLKINWTLK